MREERITLYTGNDDHIVLDLVTPFDVRRRRSHGDVRFRGGLLGHWSVWTAAAAQILARCQAAARNAAPIDAELLALDSRVTDCNSAFFDVANDFRGCIAGCHEVLRRQGLLEGIWCLDPDEGLSPGQAAADRPGVRRTSRFERRSLRGDPSRTLVELSGAS